MKGQCPGIQMLKRCVTASSPSRVFARLNGALGWANLYYKADSHVSSPQKRLPLEHGDVTWMPAGPQWKVWRRKVADFLNTSSGWMIFAPLPLISVSSAMLLSLLALLLLLDDLTQV